MHGFPHMSTYYPMVVIIKCANKQTVQSFNIVLTIMGMYVLFTFYVLVSNVIIYGLVWTSLIDLFCRF